MVNIDRGAKTEQNIDTAPFHEVQRVRQVWMWIVLGLAFSALLVLSLHQWLSGGAVAVNLLSWSAVGFSGGVLLLLAIFVYKMQLVSSIDRQGIYFRFFPLQFNYRVLRWEDIDEAYVRRYDALSEYGGWGIKFGSEGKAYTVRGKYGLQLNLQDGRSILLGTQKPIEIERQVLRFFHDFELH